jgi:predicted kinase
MAILHFISGKAGAGKTTLARQIARTAPAVVISEDEWLYRLAEPIETLQQYLTAAAKVRSIIGPLCADLLRLGTSVVFDFGGNTVNDRRWVRSVFESAGADLSSALHRRRRRHLQSPSAATKPLETGRRLLRRGHGSTG